MRRLALSLTAALGLTLASLAASANAPPEPGWCGAVGDTCYGAPPDGKSVGICAKQRCSRPTPNGPMEYDCIKCMPIPKDMLKDKPKK
jgi:hypothetical protein